MVLSSVVMCPLWLPSLGNIRLKEFFFLFPVCWVTTNKNKKLCFLQCAPLLFLFPFYSSLHNTKLVILNSKLQILLMMLCFCHHSPFILFLNYMVCVLRKKTIMHEKSHSLPPWVFFGLTSVLALLSLALYKDFPHYCGKCGKFNDFLVRLPPPLPTFSHFHSLESVVAIYKVYHNLFVCHCKIIYSSILHLLNLIFANKFHSNFSPEGFFAHLSGSAQGGCEKGKFAREYGEY